MKNPNIITTVHQTSATMDALQRKLHLAGLHATAQRVNKAVQKLGYEAAAIIEKRMKQEKKNGRH